MKTLAISTAFLFSFAGQANAQTEYRERRYTLFVRGLEYIGSMKPLDEVHDRLLDLCSSVIAELDQYIIEHKTGERFKSPHAIDLFMLPYRLSFTRLEDKIKQLIK